ncbi:MAG: fumarate hydratase, partial [Clostridia bacterium]|nr:fumarate hydratase [Clostridia bacterium]
MRELEARSITEAISRLCVEANSGVPQDLRAALEEACTREESPLGREVLLDLLRNLDAARALGVPVCQDTGMAVVFIELGQEVHITGGNLRDAVDQGVREGTAAGHLRCSVVADPLARVNSGDNTPAILHVTVADGDRVALTVAPKGFGSENMSRIKMFTPAATQDDIAAFVVGCVKEAGSRPCPPVVVGVGIGGDFEYAAL